MEEKTTSKTIKLDIDMSGIKEKIDTEINKLKNQLFADYEPYKKEIVDFIDDIATFVIESDKVPEIIEENGLKFYVAGGALTSVFCKREIKDYDIYFYDELTFNLFKNEFLGWRATKLSETTRAITFNRSGITFQLIRLFGTPEETFENFDFTINMCALVFDYDFKTNDLKSEFVFDKRFMLDNMSKSLVFNPKTLYPINSLFRVKKYKERGYKINTIELMKIALRISQLEIKTIGDIKCQVTGLSSDVMAELSNKLAEFEDDETVEDPIKFIQDVYDGLVTPKVKPVCPIPMPTLNLDELI